MSFQIKDAENKAIPISKLDEIAAKFWGKDVHKSSYANPSEYYETHIVKEKDGSLTILDPSPNWFDQIGFYVNTSPIGKVCWEDITGSITGHAVLAGVKRNDDLNNALAFYKPYIQLILHFRELNYTAYSVE